jgi:mono/diheme cytochrome c family protein
MNRRIFILVACLILAVVFTGCEYERMSDQPSLRHYEGRRPPVVTSAIPIDGGEAKYRLAPYGSVQNPFPADGKSIERGAIAYTYYCIQCHGSKFDGEGTVGQSFNPLPADLMSKDVQQYSPDELFRIISYGGAISPPLAYTIKPADRWHIINWIQSLGIRTLKTPKGTSGDFPKPSKSTQ